jgi:hypothetical protein
MTTFKQVMDELGDIQDRVDSATGVLYTRSRKQETRIPSAFAIDLFRIWRQMDDREMRVMNDSQYADHLRAWADHTKSVEKTNAALLAILERIVMALESKDQSDESSAG